MEPPAKKSRKLLEEDSSSDSGDESGGVPLGDSSTGDAFKINEDYARRFEHNKRREERLQRMLPEDVQLLENFLDANCL